MNSNKKNLFLNNSWLVTWTDSKSAFYVLSPTNPNGGIWFSSKWYAESKWDNYFAVGIIMDIDYDVIEYNAVGDNIVKSYKKISGQELYNNFKSIITERSNKYTENALALRKKISLINKKGTN